MAVRIKGVLPLLRDFDPSTLSKVKHSITKTTGSDSVKTQVTIPQLSIGASQMEPLSFLSDFKWSATIVKWKQVLYFSRNFPWTSKLSTSTHGIFFPRTLLKPFPALLLVLIRSNTSSFWMTHMKNNFNFHD